MKVLKISLILLLIFGIIAYIGYTVYVPKMITNTIATGEIPGMIPEKYHTRIEETREKVNEEIDKLPEMMNKYQLSYDELLAFAMEVKNKEVLNALEEMKNTDITSSDQAFDIALSNISAELPQSEKVKEVFKDKIPVDRIHEEITKMETSELPLSVEVDLARRIAIQLLKDKKDEIKDKLNGLQKGQ